MAALIAIDLPALDYRPEQHAAETQHRQQREEADTSAQIWMAWAAWAQVLVGALGLIGLGLTVAFAYLAWEEARISNAEAREQFLSERRPWLTVSAELREITVAPRDDDPDHLTVWLRATATNIGLTPALFTVFGAASSEGVHLFSDAREVAYEEAVDGRFAENDGRHIFPQESASESVVFHVKRQWLERGASLYLYAFYQTHHESQVRATPQLYELTWIDAAAIPETGDLPIESVEIEPSMFGPPPD